MKDGDIVKEEIDGVKYHATVRMGSALLAPTDARFREEQWAIRAYGPNSYPKPTADPRPMLKRVSANAVWSIRDEEQNALNTHRAQVWRDKFRAIGMESVTISRPT